MKYYFAYGADLNSEIFEKICPSLEKIASARLDDYEFFVDESGKPNIKKSVNSNFVHINSNFIAYAIGGIMFMDNLAKLTRREGEIEIIRQSYILAESLNIPVEEAQKKLYSAIKRHAAEWNNFLSSLNENSFIKKWIGYKNDELI